MSFVEGEITVEFGGTVGPAGPAGNAVPIAAGTVLANPTGVLANPVGVDAAGMRTLIGADVAFQPASVTALSSLSGLVTGQVVNLRGYYTAGDGGSQTLYYDSSSTATVNGGTVFNGPGGTGRFLSVDTSTIDVKRFGAKGDGATNDSTAIQAAVDSIKGTTGGVVFFPRGTYLFNVLIDGSQAIVLTGEGEDTVIKSFSASGFVASFERTFRTCGMQNISVRGDNTKLGIYVNTGSYFAVDHCDFYGCRIGIVFNATIDTKISQSVFHNNFVGIYYTCRTAPSVPLGLSETRTFTVDGQSVTLTDAFFPSQPGETTLTSVSMNVNTFGVVMDQPGNPYQPNSDFKWFGGLLQANKVGICLTQIGLTGLDMTNLLHGVWQETNGSASAVFNGVTYAGSALNQTGGVTCITGGSLDGLVLRDNAVVFLEKTHISNGSSVSIESNCSVVNKDLQSARTIVEGYSKSVIPYTSSLILTNNRSAGTSEYVATSVNPMFHASTLSWFGSGSATNVADGVLDRAECKEITLTTVGNGLIVFPASAASAKTYNLGLFAIKKVSGQDSVFLSSTDANTPFNQGTIPITSEWRTYAIIQSKYASHASGGANFLTLLSAGDTVFRLSAVAFLKFDRYADLLRFLDSNVYPMVLPVAAHNQDASTLTGTISNDRLSAQVARRDTTNTFASAQTFNSTVEVTGAATLGSTLGLAGPLTANAPSAAASRTHAILNSGTTGFAGTNDSNTEQAIEAQGCSFDGTTINLKQIGQLAFRKVGSFNDSGVPGAPIKGSVVLRAQGGTNASPALTDALVLTPTEASFSGLVELSEMTDPSAPGVNKGRIFMRDNGSGKTQLCVRFPTGAIQVIATEP